MEWPIMLEMPNRMQSLIGKPSAFLLSSSNKTATGLNHKSGCYWAVVAIGPSIKRESKMQKRSNKMEKKRVLVGSPVYQRPEILKECFVSLKNRISHSISIDFMFADENINEESSPLLSAFKREGSSVLYGIKEQYDSILDNFPNLVKWGEDETV